MAHSACNSTPPKLLLLEPHLHWRPHLSLLPALLLRPDEGNHANYISPCECKGTISSDGIYNASYGIYIYMKILQTITAQYIYIYIHVTPYLKTAPHLPDE